MAQVFIALGSNLNDPFEQVSLALTALDQLPSCHIVKVSPFYRSKPLGPQNQDDFLNAVTEIQTNLPPLILLDHLQLIEKLQGRTRKKERWGERTIDLDILLYDKIIMNDERLTIPHYDMKNREFVLYPLYDIAPSLIFPDHTDLVQLIQVTNKNGMTLWDDNSNKNN